MKNTYAGLTAKEIKEAYRERPLYTGKALGLMFISAYFAVGTLTPSAAKLQDWVLLGLLVLVGLSGLTMFLGIPRWSDIDFNKPRVLAVGMVGAGGALVTIALMLTSGANHGLPFGPYFAIIGISTIWESLRVVDVSEKRALAKAKVYSDTH